MQDSELYTLEEAMENVSIASEANEPYRLGIIDHRRLVLQDEEKEQESSYWITKGASEELIEVMRNTFSRLTVYLKGLYKNPAIDWSQETVRTGLQSMMLLVAEAGKKVDRILQELEHSCKRVPKITKSSEYKILQEFYIDNITEKFTEIPPQGDEAWRADIDQESPVKDLETIRSDAAYELFYLRNIHNKPLFKRSLIKNMRLLFDFSETLDVPLEDDPLLEIVTIKDRDLQGSAEQILRSLKPQLQDFYAYKVRTQDHDLIHALNKAIMSLMLAANEKNLIHHTFNKNCLRYFLDFQYFFREALNATEYQKLLAYPPEKDSLGAFLLRFTHCLAYEFFTRASSIRQEILGYIHRLIRKGEELTEEKERSTSLWEKLLQESEQVQALLHRYPSGPLFKMLDTLQEENQAQRFEPLQQENMPFLLFALSTANQTSHILHLPTPTKQSDLAKAEISEEFSAFLAFLHEGKKDKHHLLINLQDRTSWKESTRATVLENLQKRAEYTHNITVVTLPKDTDFYHQKDAYGDIGEASLFLETLQEQLTHPEDFGFFFGETKKSTVQFFQKLSQTMHEQIFAGEQKLTEQERRDFIELFYLFLTLKVLQDIQPDTVSFTCKDALDVGSMMSAGFFALIKLLQGSPWEKSDEDYLRLLIYAPVLMVRERSVDSRRLIRTLCAIATLEEKTTAEGWKKLQNLYKKDWIKSMRLI